MYALGLGMGVVARLWIGSNGMGAKGSSVEIGCIREWRVRIKVYEAGV